MRRHGSRLSRRGRAAPTGPTLTPPAGLAFWGDARSAYLQTTGAAVDVWTDRSGTGRTLIPTGGTDKPDYEAAAFNGISPSIRFAYANTEGMYSGAAGIGDLVSGTNKPYTIIAAAQYVSNPVNICNMFGWGYSGSNNPHIYMGHNTTPRHAIFKKNDAAGTADLTATTAPDTDPHVYSWTSTGTAATFRIDGVTTSISASAQASGAQTLDRFGVGCVMKAAPAAYGDVRIAEFLVFDSALSDAEREYVEAYLFSRHQLAAGNTLSGPLDVVFIAGQSNALGSAGATGQTWAPGPRYLRWDVGISEPTELSQLGPSPTNSFGVERQIVADMIASGKTVAVLKCARSSTAIADWQDGQVYGAALRDVYELGIPLLQAFYGSASIQIRPHFVWIHGEQDGADAGTAAAYEGALRTFMAGLDSYWGTSVHAHITQLSDTQTLVTQLATIQAAQIAVAGEQAHYHTVDPGAAQNSGDNLHYSAAGYNTLGALIATSILGTIP